MVNYDASKKEAYAESEFQDDEFLLHLEERYQIALRLVQNGYKAPNLKLWEILPLIKDFAYLLATEDYSPPVVTKEIWIDENELDDLGNAKSKTRQVESHSPGIESLKHIGSHITGICSLLERLFAEIQKPLKRKPLRRKDINRLLNKYHPIESFDSVVDTVSEGNRYVLDVDEQMAPHPYVKYFGKNVFDIVDSLEGLMLFEERQHLVQENYTYYLANQQLRCKILSQQEEIKILKKKLYSKSKTPRKVKKN